jgi:hypothetical protein
MKVRHDFGADEDCEPVIAPRNDKSLVAVAPECVQRLRDRPIFAYTNDARPFRDRVTAFCEGVVRVRPTGGHEDSDGMAIEPFELHDNLMLAGGVAASCGCLVVGTVPHTDRYTSLVAFERTVKCAAAVL